MSPTTEIALVRTTSQNTIKETVFLKALSTVSKQPGFVATYYGMGIEDDEVLNWLIDWDSIDDHKNFMGSPQYIPFMESLGPLIGGPVDMRYVKFDPYSAQPLTAPITEVFSMYLPESAPDEKKQELTQAWSNFEKGLRKADGFEGVMEGQAVESVPHKSLGDEKAYVQMALIGWKSLESHTAFRSSEPFKSTIGGIRNVIKGSDMGHVVLHKY